MTSLPWQSVHMVDPLSCIRGPDQQREPDQDMVQSMRRRRKHEKLVSTSRGGNQSRSHLSAIVTALVGLVILGNLFLSATPATAFETSCLTSEPGLLPCSVGSPSIVAFSQGDFADGVDLPDLAVTSSGMVFADGNVIQGMNGYRLVAPIVGIAAHAGPRNTCLYWLAAADGGVFAFQCSFPFQGAQFSGQWAESAWISQ